MSSTSQDSENGDVDIVDLINKNRRKMGVRLDISQLEAVNRGQNRAKGRSKEQVSKDNWIKLQKKQQILMKKQNDKIMLKNRADQLLQGIMDPIERINNELQLQKKMDEMFKETNPVKSQNKEIKHEEEKNELPKPIKVSKKFQIRAPFLKQFQMKNNCHDLKDDGASGLAANIAYNRFINETNLYFDKRHEPEVEAEYEDAHLQKIQQMTPKVYNYSEKEVVQSPKTFEKILPQKYKQRYIDLQEQKQQMGLKVEKKLKIEEKKISRQQYDLFLQINEKLKQRKLSQFQSQTTLEKLPTLFNENTLSTKDTYIGKTATTFIPRSTSTCLKPNTKRLNEQIKQIPVTHLKKVFCQKSKEINKMIKENKIDFVSMNELNYKKPNQKSQKLSRNFVDKALITENLVHVQSLKYIESKFNIKQQDISPQHNPYFSTFVEQEESKKQNNSKFQDLIFDINKRANEKPAAIFQTIDTRYNVYNNYQEQNKALKSDTAHRKKLNQLYIQAKSQTMNDVTLDSKILIDNINETEKELNNHQKTITIQMENLQQGLDSASYFEKKFNEKFKIYKNNMIRDTSNISQKLNYSVLKERDPKKYSLFNLK